MLIAKILQLFQPKTVNTKKSKTKKSKYKQSDIVTLYGVFPSSDHNKMLAVVSDLQEASEVVGKYTFYSHYNEYKQWCERNYPSATSISDSTLWSQFMNDYFNEDDEGDTFSIATMEFPIDEVASVMRMFYQCPPLGFSFSDVEEEGMYITSVDPDDYSIEYKNFLKAQQDKNGLNKYKTNKPVDNETDPNKN